MVTCVQIYNFEHEELPHSLPCQYVSLDQKRLQESLVQSGTFSIRSPKKYELESCKRLAYSSVSNTTDCLVATEAGSLAKEVLTVLLYLVPSDMGTEDSISEFV